MISCNKTFISVKSFYGKLPISYSMTIKIQYLIIKLIFLNFKRKTKKNAFWNLPVLTNFYILLLS